MPTGIQYLSVIFPVLIKFTKQHRGSIFTGQGNDSMPTEPPALRYCTLNYEYNGTSILNKPVARLYSNCVI